MEDTPQLGNGFMQIATEIQDALCKVRIPGEARQVLDVVLRKTYGFHKKEDRIALSQFVKATNLKNSTVCRAIQKLRAMNLIIVTKKETDDNYYSFNKKHKEWRPLPKKITLPKKIINITQKDNPALPKMLDTKDTLTKDTTKDIAAKIAADPIKTPKSKSQKYADQTPYSLSEFVASMRASPQRYIRIIGEYADTQKTHLETKGQWRRFTDRNVRAAKNLEPFTDIQISRAFERIERAKYITKWTLETLEKYIE